MSKIRTEISIESCESFIIKRKRQSIRSWCARCEKIGIFVLPTEAGFLAGMDIDRIVSFIYSGELHAANFPVQGTFVCLTSLCLGVYSAGGENGDGEYEEIGLIDGYEEIGFSLRSLG